MPSVIRTKEETVATVTATHRKIRVFVNRELTIEESRELRGLLKKQERVAEGQGASGGWDFTINPNLSAFQRYYGGVIR